MHRTKTIFTAASAGLLLASVCPPASGAAKIVPAELPAGLELVLAAAPPLVTHPIMGAFDDRGRLFVGDAAGLNLNKKDLEEQLPNRVLMLEDVDGDGVFDKSTLFADRMTFPQGACWVDGSLFVASPPGIWKLTDRDGDGVAEQREMIVGGFEYDGNAADVHGPFLHPDGRLYWCHGRKGHKVTQRDGTPVHEGRASGIWSCRTDGSDVQWHSLGSMDNPVEVDFTPAGDVVGVVNIHYNQPRADTLVHWIRGGVYERPDQLGAIAGLPRTIKDMPYVHDFGHVAVSGCAFYRSGALNPSWQGDMFVALFNTQEIVRVKLARQGATFVATQHEFLRMPNPDVHITDLIEDGDGSLLVLDTGGWFRLGCPSSLAAKPDLRGAIYRVQRRNAPRPADPYGREIPWTQLSREDAGRWLQDERWMVRVRAERLAGRGLEKPPLLAGATSPVDRLRACEELALAKKINPVQRAALLQMLGEPLEPVLEHAAMFAGIATRAFDLDELQRATAATVIRRLMIIVEQSAPEPKAHDALLQFARQQTDSADAELAQTAVQVVVRHPRALEMLHGEFAAELRAANIAAGSLGVMVEVAAAHLARPAAQELLTLMLMHGQSGVRTAAWSVLARQSGNISHPDWLAPLNESLQAAIQGRAGAELPTLLDAIARLRSDYFDRTLQDLVGREDLAGSLRIKALSALARPGQPVTPDAFASLLALTRSDSAPGARAEAARLLARSRLTQEQLLALAPVVQAAGPVELRALLPLARRGAELATGRRWAAALAQSPFIGSIEESLIRTNFSSLPPEVYEQMIAPAVRKASDARHARRRQFEALAADAARGRSAAGRNVYANSSCVACHRAGDLGRALGPDLSRIGGIRQPRDLLESIFFPNATIAREFETHVVETQDGQSVTAMVRAETEDALQVIDATGQERSIPRPQIVANHVLPGSLMPEGLDQALTEQQLLDLVAWLCSLK